MAEGLIHRGDGIIVLVATETITNEKLEISHIILTGTAAGSFVLVLGEVTLTITTGANDLSKVILIGRKVNYLKLTSGPAGAKLYAFLKKK